MVKKRKYDDDFIDKASYSVNRCFENCQCMKELLDSR